MCNKTKQFQSVRRQTSRIKAARPIAINQLTRNIRSGGKAEKKKNSYFNKDFSAGFFLQVEKERKEGITDGKKNK